MYAILEALLHLSDSNHPSSIIYSDSRSSIQLIDKLTSNHPIVTQIHCCLSRLAASGKLVKFCWVPGHVNVHGNDAADRLAGEAATSNAPIDRPQVPYKDYYPSVRTNLLNRWQNEWTNTPQTNKLRSFRDSVRPWRSSHQKVRAHEVMLTRLRIGHTRLTHGHLMRGEPLPYCDNCIVPLTIKHILIECPDYAELRQRLFGINPNLNKILGEPINGNFNINSIITFLNDINLLHEI